MAAQVQKNWIGDYLNLELNSLLLKAINRKA